ncbi:MAG: WXG100 family type VII secretion target [Lachnospiraceae bacterium]|nr:WXG100 family type VII secretion target [Lachnospiraceae bacterium]MBR6526969.1 WXG100 family type VII secretion target [Lachnospiraceae bacterium]
MAKLKVEISALRTNQTNLEKQIADLEALNRRLETLLARIESSWDGDASDSYIRVMRGYAQQAADMVKVLTEFKTYVNKTADTFENLDKKISSRIFGAF